MRPLRLRRASLVGLALATTAGALTFGPVSPVHATDGTTPDYSLTLLPTPAGTSTLGRDISDAGDVVGEVQAPGQPQTAAYWHRGSLRRSRLLGLPDAATTRVAAINDAGDVAGSSFTSFPRQATALRWVNPDEPIALDDGVADDPDLDQSMASSIADDGSVVGTITTSARTQAFAIDPSGQPRRLPDPEATEPITSSRSYDIDTDGDVLGNVKYPHPHDDHVHTVATPVVWKSDDTIDLLEGPIEGFASVGFAMNDADVVVGDGVHEDFKTWQAVVWRDGEAIWLPTLDGFTHSRAQDITSDGDIVGYSSPTYANSSAGAATLWHDGTAVDLNSVAGVPENVVLRDAEAINDAGQIVGTASMPDGSTRAYLLTPVVPAPSESRVNLEVTPEPHRFGRPATVTIEVARADGDTASGQVAVSVDGRAPGTIALTAGRAHVTLPRPDIGQHVVQVDYLGDETARPSDAVLRFNTRRARTATRLRVLTPRVRVGRRVRVRVVVEALGTRPHGRVLLRQGRAGRILATGQLKKGAVALTIRVTRPLGRTTVTAVYTGNMRHLVSRSSRTLRVVR